MSRSWGFDVGMKGARLGNWRKCAKWNTHLSSQAQQHCLLVTEVTNLHALSRYYQYPFGPTQFTTYCIMSPTLTPKTNQVPTITTSSQVTSIGVPPCLETSFLILYLEIPHKDRSLLSLMVDYMTEPAHLLIQRKTPY